MRRAWKILQRIGIGLVILAAALLMIVAVLNWRANSRLEERLATIRAAGEPVTLAELAGEPVPPEQNAVTHLRQVERQVIAIEIELKDVISLQGPFRQDGKLNAEGAAKVRAVLEAHAEVLRALAKAVDCPVYDPLDALVDPQAPTALPAQMAVLDSVIARTQVCRATARLMMLQADLAAFDGKFDEALRTCVQALRFSGQLENEPFTVGFLVALAVRSGVLDRLNLLLGQGPMLTENHRLLQDEIARLDATSGFVRCLKQERVFGIARFREMMPGRLPLWYARNWECDYLDVMAAELRIGALPRHLIEDELAAQQGRVADANILIRLVYPALAAARDAMDRVRATGRCLVVLSAFQQAAAETGEGDFSLDRLRLDPELTTDPFTGKPLLVKETPDGWVVYSVGRDGKDDGGAIDVPYADIGAGPVRAAGRKEN